MLHVQLTRAYGPDPNERILLPVISMQPRNTLFRLKDAYPHVCLPTHRAVALWLLLDGT